MKLTLNSETCNYCSICSLYFVTAVTLLLPSKSELLHAIVHLQYSGLRIKTSLPHSCVLVFHLVQSKASQTMRNTNIPEWHVSVQWLFFPCCCLDEASELGIWLSSGFQFFWSCLCLKCPLSSSVSELQICSVLSALLQVSLPCHALPCQELCWAVSQSEQSAQSQPRKTKLWKYHWFSRQLQIGIWSCFY